MDKPQTIDEYIRGFAGQGRELLRQLHALARETVPGASEAIKWGYPTWVHPSGTILFAVRGHTRHANFAFTPSTRDAFETELVGMETGRHTVRIPYDRPAPTDLLRRMITYRVREHEERGVLWM
ncbi:DUF1801 domain-containing protein [Catellatospora sp. KI3]|uniref:iron chaperone n=1 Tax=Catellatospora sp. KI3 TaxID=3041620 RepID=UPI002482B105|nr:DUF1801 domain-containing protein [Catellatospora sp. KI3]MDI1460459.1 DUF1801 domain-containing protein [Catellatospora sp. KI3]